MPNATRTKLDASQAMRRFHAYRASLRAQRLNLRPPGERAL